MTGHDHGRRAVLRRRHYHSHRQRGYVDPEPVDVDIGIVGHIVEPLIEPTAVAAAPTKAYQALERRATSTCAPDDKSPACEKPAGAQNNTLPILLGALWVS